MTRLPLLLLLAPLSSWAQSVNDPWYLGGALSLNRTDNVYRVGGATAPSNDWIAGASLLAGGNLRLGRQRLYLDSSVRRSDYRHNDSLNHLSYTLNGGWDWVLGSDLSGNFGVGARRALAPFNSGLIDKVSTTKNIEDQKSAQFSLVYGLVGTFRWDANAYTQWRDYSDPDFFKFDYRIRSAGTGLRWVPGQNLTLRVGVRESRVLYAKALPPDSFRRRDLESSADWRATATQNFRLSLSRGKTRHTTQSHYEDGTSGSLDWIWTPSPRLKTTLSAARERGSDTRSIGMIFTPTLGMATLDQTDSRRVDTLRAQASYEISGKLFFDINASQSTRLLSTLVSTKLVEGEDRTRNLSLGLRWPFARQGQLGCDWSTERRTSNVPSSLPYTTRNLGCNLQWMLS